MDCFMNEYTYLVGGTAPCHVERVVAELFVPLLVPSPLSFSGVVVVVAGRQAEVVDVSNCQPGPPPRVRAKEGWRW